MIDLTKRHLLTAAAAVALPISVGVSGLVGAQEGTPTATQCPAATPVAVAGVTGTPEAVEAEACLTVEMVDIDFNPNDFTIPANIPVELVFPNNGAILHNFSLDDKNNEELPIEPLDVDVEPAEVKSVVLNLPPGEYYYYCDIAGHEAAGMFGTITVEEGAEISTATPDGTPAADA